VIGEDKKEYELAIVNARRALLMIWAEEVH
jgi:hypothetical protein